MDKNLILLLIIIAVWFLVIRNLSTAPRTGNNGSTGGPADSRSWDNKSSSAVGRSYTT